MTYPRQLSLNAFLMATGHHVAAWRHSRVASDPLDFSVYRRAALIAEAAKLDALFVADSLAVPTDEIAAHTARSVYFEPLTLLSALAALTERIGLIATVTTSYNEPYHVECVSLWLKTLRM
jgi:alkanesulfonate monooxygenase SsuD/methylene tetrahydromethanopterin reductase-like flavin-dependent oxidoreductase (luciferase family)